MALSCTVAAAVPSRATNTVIAAPGAISPIVHRLPMQLIPCDWGGVGQTTLTPPSAVVTAVHADANGESRRNPDVGETDTLAAGDVTVDRLTTSINVPEMPPAENARGLTKARSIDDPIGLLVLHVSHWTPTIPVALTELTTAPLAPEATVAEIVTRLCPLKPGGIVQVKLLPGTGDTLSHWTPLPGITEILTTDVGKTSRNSNEAVVVPPVLFAESVQEITSLTPTCEPEAGNEDLLTTMSAGGDTERLDTASQLDGLHVTLLPEIAARLVTLTVALLETTALTE